MECENCEGEIRGVVTRLILGGRYKQYCFLCGKIIKEKIEKEINQVEE